MKILSTNIGNATIIFCNGKKEKTGIFKYPVNQTLYLQKNDVAKDTIIDRQHHIKHAIYLLLKTTPTGKEYITF